MGHLKTTMTAMPPHFEREPTVDKLSELVARQEIHDVLVRYARGVDRRDWPTVRACFHDDADDQHGEFTGGADAFVDWVSTRHASIPFAMHFLGNCLIEFLGPEAAFVETYFIAMQRRETSSGEPKSKTVATDVDVFARYCDRFERRAGEWRIASRRVVYDSTRTQASSNHLRKLVGVLGRRDHGDPVYRLKDAAE
jgi:SnoaL-like domain